MPVCVNATRVMIDSARKHGILLEAVQVLTDLNLSIKKAYISCDGGGSWTVSTSKASWISVLFC
ncbi:ACT domain repeat 6 [Actinidia rufa]|uniref:ACT domain-containing protein ACR n=1 Tax=Actinidia rufa TaxID=165716 RepID=A0A7J0EJ71_9ERIC|nr:ACT domain repeat 6 [Actinidia rufa]